MICFDSHEIVTLLDKRKSGIGKPMHLANVFPLCLYTQICDRFHEADDVHVPLTLTSCML